MAQRLAQRSLSVLPRWCRRSVVRSLHASSASLGIVEKQGPAPWFASPPPGIVEDSLETSELTVLENGVRVVSKADAGAVSVVGVIVDGGTNDQRDGASGVVHLMERMAFKSTSSMSHDQLVGLLESTGINAIASGQRETTFYMAEALRGDWKLGMDVVGDTMQNALMADDEVQDQRDTIYFEHLQMQDQPDMLINEMLHKAAYGGKRLGESLQCSPEQAQLLTADSIRDFQKDHFVGDRLVVTGLCVDHNELVEHAQRWFGHYPKEGPKRDRSSVYVGGELKTIGELCFLLRESTSIVMPEDREYPLPDGGEQYGNVGLAFPLSGWWERDSIVASVLQMLFGGGTSFSSGGPGKGLYARFYQNVMNRFVWIRSAQALTHMYEESGLFAFTGSAPMGHTSECLGVMCQDIRSVLMGDISEDELKRAKAQLKSAMLMALETRAIRFEDLGRQMTTYGRVMGSAELASYIEAVTKDDVIELLHRMVQSPPTLVSFGPVEDVPPVQAVQQFFAS